MLAQQAHLGGGFAQVQHRQRLALPVPLAYPVFQQAQFRRGGLDMGWRKVSGPGQPDAFVSDPVQDPGIGTHHPGGRHGNDVWLARQRRADQPAQFPARIAVPDRAEEFLQRAGQVARRVRPLGPRAGRETLGQFGIDDVDPEWVQAVAIGVELDPVHPLELDDSVTVVRIERIDGCADQLIAARAAAVLGRAVAPAVQAGRRGRGVVPWRHGLEPDDVFPAVAEVIEVAQRVAGIREHFVEAYLFLGHAGLALLHLIRAQVVLGLGTVMPRTGAELVQVTVGPAERDLEDLVDLVEEQAGCQLKSPPQWRLGSGEIDPDPVPDQIGPSRAPPGLRCGEVSSVGRVRRATGDLGGKPPDQIRWRLRDIAGMVAARHAARLPVLASFYICLRLEN